jgi:carboxypeptidase Q
MIFLSRARLPLVLLLPLPAFLFAQQEKVDLNAIYRIKTEAFQNSKVMDHMFYLTDVYGPRLTGSPGYLRAAEWCVSKLKEWGIDNAHLEKWGPFGKGWQNERLAVNLVEPSYAPLIATATAWTGSTNGPVTAEPMLAVLRTEQDFEKWRGKLNGKVILIDAARDLTTHDQAEARRFNEQQLEELAMAPAPGSSPFRAPAPAAPGPAGPPQSTMAQQVAFRRKLAAFLRDEGTAVVITDSTRGDGGTVFGAGTGSREMKEGVLPPTITLTPEHYNRIVRLIDKNIPVKLEIDVKNAFFEDDLDSFNVIGEIPGGRKKSEIVMLGAHLDSWNYATGATDNGAGSAVMLEAMRILKKLNFPLDRTVRLGLWSGEEQGLLGSKAYVKQTFADRETMKTTAEWEALSGYYNVDNGTGKIRGIYLQGNDMVRPIFEAWLAPFRDLGVTTITGRNTGGTDHLSFDAVGLPGFQFIQDPMEYDTRTHHSNMDSYDRIQRGDMMQMSAIVASMVYHTAQREEKLPRKPKPVPQPAGSQAAGSPTLN